MLTSINFVLDECTAQIGDGELDGYDLEEAAVSVMRRGKGSKRAALAGGTAMQIAKRRNPGLFKKYTKYNLMRKQIKAQINRQYGAMARAAARQKIK